MDFEEYYTEVKSLPGVNFIARLPESVEQMGQDQNILIHAKDPEKNVSIEDKADLLVLATAMVPRMGAEAVKEILGVCTHESGFFRPANPQKSQIETYDPGKFICGCATAPKNIMESITEAQAAASNVGGLLTQGTKVLELTTAQVDEDVCSGCGVCVKTCHFDATFINLQKKVAEVDDTLCRGCGNCVTACPSGARNLRLSSNESILAQIDALSDSMLENEQRVLIFCCHYCAYGAADEAGASGYKYPVNTRIIRIPCSGRLDLQFIVYAFRRGFDGVVLAGCHLGSCYNVLGNYDLQNRLELLKGILNSLGIGEERIKLFWAAATEGKHFADEITEFVNRIALMDPISTKAKSKAVSD